MNEGRVAPASATPPTIVPDHLLARIVRATEAIEDDEPELALAILMDVEVELAACGRSRS
jgi:hypothetical protein